MRRALILSFFVLAVPLSGDVRAQQPPPPTQLSLATLAPPGSVIMRGFDAWNRELGRRTNGSLRFRFYAGGVQGDEAEMLRKMRSGRIDAATLTMTGLAQLDHRALVLQLPGTFRTYEQLERARTALGPEIIAAIEHGGVHLLGWGDIGQARIFSTRPVHTPQDLTGLHVWSRRDDLLLPSFFAEVHTTPVALEVPEVLGALQTNRIDTYFAPPAVAIGLQWSQRSTHMSDLPLTIVIGATVVSDAAWRRLTPEQQAAMTETAAQFSALAKRNVRAFEAQSLHALTTHGIQTVVTSDADRAAWIALGARVRARVTTIIGDASLVQRAAALAN